MLKVTVPSLTKFPDVGYTRADMIKIAAKALETISKRLDQGKGVMDSKMKPLSPGYAATKKKMGAAPVRNLMFSGSMRGALVPTGISANKVTLGYTRRSEEAKAAANQNRSAWFGLSPNDESIVKSYALGLLKAKLK